MSTAVAIPPLDRRGLLPPGEHVCTLQDIAARFARSTTRRQALWDQFTLFVNRELLPWASGMSLVVGGSFLSDKAEPDDIDATLRIPLTHVGSNVAAITTVGSESGMARIFLAYRVHFFVTFLGFGNDFGAFFQYVGEKTAALRNLQEKDLRGVCIVTLP